MGEKKQWLTFAEDLESMLGSILVEILVIFDIFSETHIHGGVELLDGGIVVIQTQLHLRSVVLPVVHFQGTLDELLAHLGLVGLGTEHLCTPKVVVNEEVL